MDIDTNSYIYMTLGTSTYTSFKPTSKTYNPSDIVVTICYVIGWEEYRGGYRGG